MKEGIIYDKIFDKPCEVCGKMIKKDVYGQGECQYCGWYNCHFNVENPNSVAYPNLIALNKAEILYKEGKPFEPDFDDFIEALFCYSEMQFEYNGICYTVELVGKNEEENNIQVYNSQTKEIQVFKNKTDFKNNARVEGKLLKDIWDETTDRYWLQ